MKLFFFLIKYLTGRDTREKNGSFFKRTLPFSHLSTIYYSRDGLFKCIFRVCWRSRIYRQDEDLCYTSTTIS